MSMRGFKIQDLRFKTQERGSVFIMTLIITSGILVIGIEISTLLISSIRNARALDAGIAARYAAESALENGLYQIRKEERDVLRLDHGEAGKSSWSFQPVNPAGTVRFSPTIPVLEKPMLTKESVVQFSLYTQNGNGTSAIPGLDSIRLTWDAIEESCLNAVPQQIPGIEISVVKWNEGPINWSEPNMEIFKSFLQEEAFLAGKTAQLGFDSLEPGLSAKPMAVRVKVYFCDIKGLRIDFPEKGNQAASIPIPNYFFLRPVGVLGTIQQDLQAIVPKDSTISDIFDFTFFSEEKVIKTE